MAAIDVDALWNFGDPAASEQRFRAALAGAHGDDALVLRTQIARTLGLRGRFDEAHAELDVLAAALATAGPEPRVRAALERGRALRSAGRAAESEPHFRQAFDSAEAARLRALAADALHMLALVAPTADARIDGNRRALDYVRATDDAAARRWEGPLLNNLGHELREAGRLDESLEVFRASQAAHARAGRSGAERIARWQVAHGLRRLGRSDEALAMQLALERDNAAAGTPDGHVYDELAALYAARGDAARAAHYRRLKAALEKQP